MIEYIAEYKCVPFQFPLTFKVSKNSSANNFRPYTSRVKLL